jgi:hypothetical protein
MRPMVVAALAASIAAAGCQSTQETTHRLQSSWIGRSSDEFFIKHGAPVNEFTLANGGKIYTWDGARAQVHVPDMPSSNTSYVGTPYGGTLSVTTTEWSGGYSANLSCVVQIVTDKNRNIVEIRASKDTIGMWNLSRCAETFGSA